MIEFVNEGDLDIDYPRAHHTRPELVSLLRRLAGAMRGAGDRHLIDSGNSAPRPAAEHLSLGQGWKRDSREEFLQALDAETPPGVDVASVHLYPEPGDARPWDGGDVLDMLPALAAHARRSCQPVFVGEFGARDLASEDRYVARVAASSAPSRSGLGLWPARRRSVFVRNGCARPGGAAAPPASKRALRRLIGQARPRAFEAGAAGLWREP